MARTLYEPRPRPRLSEPFRHTVPRPSKHSHARRSLPPQQPGPPGASMWGGVAPKGGPAVLVPDSDSDEPLETGGTGRGSDSDDAWGSESDWSESPGYAGAAAGVSPVGAGEPSLASAHAMAAAQSFKHMSLFAASGLDDDDFDVRAASALDESKDLLRFVAEAAPVAFTSQMRKLEAAQDACVKALQSDKDKLVGPGAQHAAAQVKELLELLAGLRDREAANRASTLDALRSIRQETEAALAAAAERHDAAHAKLHRDLQALYGLDAAPGGGTKGKGKGRARKTPAGGAVKRR